MMGGGGGGAKIKIAQGKQKEIKIRAPKIFENKICADRENYKLK